MTSTQMVTDGQSTTELLRSQSEGPRAHPPSSYVSRSLLRVLREAGRDCS
jgi:hypothetical protein